MEVPYEVLPRCPSDITNIEDIGEACHKVGYSHKIYYREDLEFTFDFKYLVYVRK